MRVPSVRRRDDLDADDRHMNHASASKRQELRLRVVCAGGKHVFRPPGDGRDTVDV
jgi:hypothetical protein